MTKDSFNTLTIIRYIIYFSVAASIIVSGDRSLILLLVLLLVYMINSQVRISILKNKTYAVIISLIIEIVVISVMCVEFGGFTFVYYFISLLDSSTLLNKKPSLFINAIIYIAVVIQSIHPNYMYLQNNPAVNIIFNTMIIIGFGGLGRYVNEQIGRKADAQRLYDRLRISEQELKEAYSRLEQYSKTVEELTVMKERNRISREIHDTVGHTMSTLTVQLQALPFIIKSDPGQAEIMLNDMLSFTKTGLEDVRRAVRELNPSSFDNNNGIFVLQELAYNFQKNSGVKVRFTISGEESVLDSEQSLILYRIMQESFNNSLRHGNASLIEINLNFGREELYMRIKDNGKGCESLNKGFGISGMEQRVKSSGGKIDFHVGKGSGFEINLLLPKNTVIL